MTQSRKQKNIEFAKSVILVVLFLSTILLLYGFWWNVKPSDINIDNFANQNDTYVSFTAQEVIAPGIIEISHGDGRYGTINRDTRKYWWDPTGQSFTGLMMDFFASGDIFVESISQEQYQEVLASESIKVVFDYDLPFRETLQLYNIFQPSGTSNISYISQVAYSFASMESLFIYDRQQDSYYRLVGEGDFAKDNSSIPIYKELIEASYIAYPLYQLVGEETVNSTLVPLPTEFSYTIRTYNNERNIGGKIFEKNLARTFFGDSFDFTRVVEDAKGGVTYMYGYGERVFIAEKDGSFRYKREGASKKPLTDLESLEMALDFIARHGGSENSQGEIEDIRLSKVKKTYEKFPVTTFYFQIQKETSILYEEGAPLIVECTGDTVTSFSRDLFIVESLQQKTLSAGEYTAINVLAKNYQEMAQTLKKEGFLDYKQDQAFQEVVEGTKAIRLVETRFRKNEEGIGKLETCWSFSFQNKEQTMEFYYSIRDALPMGYSLR